MEQMNWGEHIRGQQMKEEKTLNLKTRIEFDCKFDLFFGTKKLSHKF